MRTSFPIGRILGIPIRVHASWFIVLAVVTWSMSTQMFARHPPAVGALAGLLTALAMFGSVLLHELGHCVFARFFGIHVRRIQLFLFGGVAEIVGEPRRVIDEIIIAAAGPAVSFALFALLGASAIAWSRIAAPALDPLEAVNDLTRRGGLVFTFLGVVSMANGVLGLFNLVPAFPTDGGRILRAVLWGVLGDYRRATAIAAGLGMVFAGGFILLGLGSAFTAGWRVEAGEVAGARVGGLWWAMIGVFLARSASQAGAQARVSDALRSARLRDVMSPIRPPVEADRTLLDVLLRVGGPSASEMLVDGFPVAGADGRVVGFVEPSRLHEIPRERWGSSPVSSVMTPIDAMPRLPEDESLDALLRVVSEQGIGALVVRGDALVGYAGRADLARYVFRKELAGDEATPEPG